MSNAGIPYAVSQQVATTIAASVTSTTAAAANTFLTIDKQRSAIKCICTLNQPTIVLKNGLLWHVFPAAAAGSYPSFVDDVSTNNGYFPVGDSFTVYAISATPTSGTLYGVAY